MKYIRTKYGIGEVVHVVEGNTCTDIDGNVTTWTEYVVKYKHKKWRVRLSEQDSENAKLSDTIEKLCDCFIYWFNEADRAVIVSAYEMGYVPHGFTIKQIYGAIWTDKGLIYVAKMNEEGEWELL